MSLDAECPLYNYTTKTHGVYELLISKFTLIHFFTIIFSVHICFICSLLGKHVAKTNTYFEQNSKSSINPRC